jgi:DNA (cytosine-5)-methyltransferase 1
VTHGSLFSGIGGFDLAAEWMGWDNLFHCEWNSFGQHVLKYYWPETISYNDITQTDFTIWNRRIDILTGGFPCQPYSTAGKRLGTDDERHLWPEMLRAIREIQPRWVVGENVFGLVNWNDGMVFDEVQADLEAEGYEVQPYVLPACAVNAPHRRERVWFVAYRNRNGLHQRYGEHEIDTSQRGVNALGDVDKVGIDVADSDGKGLESRRIGRGLKKKGRKTANRYAIEYPSNGWKTQKPDWKDFPTTKPTVCMRNDGLPTGLDGITFPKWRVESIKGYGNAIVPQVAYQIFRAIQEYEARIEPHNRR